MDPAVGLAGWHCPASGSTRTALGVIHAGDAQSAARAAQHLQLAYGLGEERPADAVPVVLDRR